MMVCGCSCARLARGSLSSCLVVQGDRSPAMFCRKGLHADSAVSMPPRPTNSARDPKGSTLCETAACSCRQGQVGQLRAGSLKVAAQMSAATSYRA